MSDIEEQMSNIQSHRPAAAGPWLLPHHRQAELQWAHDDARWQRRHQQPLLFIMSPCFVFIFTVVKNVCW